MNETMQLLTNVFLFDGLNDTQLDQISSIATTLTLQKGAMLFSEGDPAISFYGIVSGKVKIFRISDAGSEFTVHIQSKGDLIAEAAIFDLKRYPAYCQALEETQLIRIPSAEFVALIRKQPELALSIMHAYSKRLRHFVRTLGDLSFGDVKSRLAGFLLRNAVDRQGQLVCTLKISKRELSSLLGTVPETLSRNLRGFKDKGVIEEHGTEISILKPEMLKKLLQ
jgi:CRP/FNR family transcriptional regulator, dissimilatory nitrate respiration regulator